MAYEYMDDCLHLRACRRLCKRCGIRSRGCNEKCTAYISENDHTLIKNKDLQHAFYEVSEIAENGFDFFDDSASIQAGWNVVEEKKIVFSNPLEETENQPPRELPANSFQI